MSVRVRVDDACYQVEGCLLDKDGTLLSFDHWLQVMRVRAERLASTLSLSPAASQQLLAFMGLDGEAGTRPSGIIPMARSEAEAAVAGYLSEMTQLTPTEAADLVRTVFASVDAAFPFEDHLRPTAGAEAFLRALRSAGGRVAIVTHDSGAAAHRHLRALGWEGLVDAVVGIDGAHRPKPAPDFLLAACVELGVQPDRCMMAGDAGTDVDAGRAAGCRPVVGLLSGIGTQSCLQDADHIIADLSRITVTGCGTNE